MPQNNPSATTHSGQNLRSFQIAQDTQSGTSKLGEEGAGHTVGTVHEEAHKAGDIPNAVLLFWNSVLVVVLMLVFALMACRQLEKIPKGMANLAEYAVESLTNFSIQIIGPGGRKYTPLVGTIFLYILLMNLIGLIPGLHSPTGNLSITLALGIVVFVYVQYQGIRSSGLIGYLKHFAGPMPAMAILMFPVEVISEIVKPFTLAVRLFGNIFGEDVIIGVLAGLGVAGGLATQWIPFHFPLLLLSLLTSLVQAMVFTILTCIYISLMTHHDHEDHGEEAAHVGGHAHATGH